MKSAKTACVTLSCHTHMAKAQVLSNESFGPGSGYVKHFPTMLTEDSQNVKYIPRHDLVSLMLRLLSAYSFSANRATGTPLVPLKTCATARYTNIYGLAVPPAGQWKKDH